MDDFLITSPSSRFVCCQHLSKYLQVLLVHWEPSALVAEHFVHSVVLIVIY